MPVPNPYRDINWSDVRRVSSTSHMHLTSQKDLENAYAHGIRHFAISNYYPSAPYNAETRLSDFWLNQTWPVYKRDGSMLQPPINWNEVITWTEELDEEWREKLPVAETGKVFRNIPSDAMLCNNAEHHGFSNVPCGLHVNSPGSAYCSGNINVVNRYHLQERGFPIGFGGTWQELFQGIIDGLDYPDGGGVVINHPTWFSDIPDAFVFEMLDFDERVIGMEIYNDLSYGYTQSGKRALDFQDEEPGFSLNLWDRVLSSGRKCLGFAVPDHSARAGGGGDWHGRIVLLVPEFTEHECLRAFRNGNFYACMKDNGLTVTGFSADAEKATVRLNAQAAIRFIADGEVLLEASGSSAEFAIPQRNGRPAITYLRIEATDETGERLILQPVMMPR